MIEFYKMGFNITSR